MIKIEIIDAHTLDAEVLRKTAAYLLSFTENITVQVSTLDNENTIQKKSVVSDIEWNLGIESTKINADISKKKRLKTSVPVSPSPVVTASIPPFLSIPEIPDGEDQYRELMSIITENVATGKLHPKKMLEILAEFNCSSVVMIKDNSRLLPKVLSRFKDIIDN